MYDEGAPFNLDIAWKSRELPASSLFLLKWGQGGQKPQMKMFAGKNLSLLTSGLYLLRESDFNIYAKKTRLHLDPDRELQITNWLQTITNWLQSDCKLITNYYKLLQTDYKLITNWLQIDYKLITNWLKTDYQTD